MEVDIIMQSQEVIECQKALEAITKIHELDQIKARFCGRNGIITKQMQALIDISSLDQRKIAGARLNKIKLIILEILREKRRPFEAALLAKKSSATKQDHIIDISLPSKIVPVGSIHPISRAYKDIMNILQQFGFQSVDGPNIEDEWHNFTALNIDEHHPARSMHDTFYLRSGRLLRTHTSTVQIRAMRTHKPPFKITSCGRVYRSDSDMTHTPMFHQIEGVVVDESVTMAHLKTFLQTLINHFFEKEVAMRIRPSYFPFTEPSVEVDIKLGNNTKWLEVFACGMIHPNVLKNVEIDSQKYQGFAFGLGLDRFAMLKYDIGDLRQMFNADARFAQYYNKQ